MENRMKWNFKNNERILIGLISIITGLIIAYISIIGPLVLNILTYKSSASGVFQFIGQDLLNLVFVVPVLIVGGILLLLKRPISISMLTFLPIYLIYYGLSYAIGIEWGSMSFSGNSEQYIFFYVEIIISSLFILLYCIDNFQYKEMNFRKRSLIIYSTLATIFTILYAISYIQIINLNLVEPTKEYLDAPTLFWFVKTFDLCFSIPLMGISIYLLWTRPLKSYLIQILNFGFFITMTSAVNSMAIVMYLNSDPAYSLPAHALFIILEIISITGFLFILKSTKKS